MAKRWPWLRDHGPLHLWAVCWAVALSLIGVAAVMAFTRQLVQPERVGLALASGAVGLISAIWLAYLQPRPALLSRAGLVTVFAVPLGVGCVALIEAADAEWETVLLLSASSFLVAFWRSRSQPFVGAGGAERFASAVERLGERLERASASAPPPEPIPELEPRAFETSELVAEIRLHWGDRLLCWLHADRRLSARAPLLAQVLGQDPASLLEPIAGGLRVHMPAGALSSRLEPEASLTERRTCDLRPDDQLHISFPGSLTVSVTATRGVRAIGRGFPAPRPYVAFVLAAAGVLGVSAWFSAPRLPPSELTPDQFFTIQTYLDAAERREEELGEASAGNWRRRPYRDSYRDRSLDDQDSGILGGSFACELPWSPSWQWGSEPSYERPAMPLCAWGDCADGGLRSPWLKQDCAHVGRFGLQVEAPARLAGWGIDYAAYRPDTPRYFPHFVADGPAPERQLKASFNVYPERWKPRYQAAQWARAGAVHTCLAEGLRRDPKLAGTATLLCRLDASGECRAVHQRDLLPDSRVLACLERVHRGRYPTPPEPVMLTFQYELPAVRP